MAQTNLWSTYDLGYSAGSGIYESVNAALQQIDPTDTPGVSQFGETMVKAVTHDWLVSTLNATSTAGVEEGRDFVGSARAPRWRYTNTCQIFTNDIVISDTAQWTSNIGVENEYLHAMADETINQRRNIEATLWKISSASATGDESTARTMKGLRGFTGTGVPSAPSNAPSINIVSGATAIATAEIVSMHQTAFTRGVKADSLWFSPGVKTQFVNACIASGNNLRFNLPADDSMLYADVEVFRSPFGLLRVNTDVFIPQSTASSASCGWFLLDKSKVRLAWAPGQKYKHVEIAKVGASVRGQVTSELTVELLHPYAVNVATGVVGG
jgi:hypothetical protein